MRALALAILLAIAACARLGEPTPTPTPLPDLGPTDKPLATARIGEIAETLQANGQVAPKQEATLYFARGGRLARLNAQIGQPVKKGDLLATLETDDFAARFERARLQLDVARLELQRAVENAPDEADPPLRAAAAKLALAYTLRTQALAALAQASADSSADRAVLDRARDEAAVMLLNATDEYARVVNAVNTSPARALVAANAELQLAVKKAQLAEVDLDALERQIVESRLVAPFDGVVTSASGREGDTIEAYKPVAVVADPSELVVAIELAPADTNKVAVGQEAKVVLDALQGQSFPAKVLAAPGAADVAKPEAARVTVSLAPPNPIDLGSRASVTIVTREKQGAVLVPAGALRREGDRVYVQVVTPEGDLRDSDVTVGIRTAGEVEITAGVKEGEQVVAAA